MELTTMWAILGSVFMFCVLIGSLFSPPKPEKTSEQKKVSIYMNCEHSCVNTAPKQECIDKCLNYVNKNNESN